MLHKFVLNPTTITKSIGEHDGFYPIKQDFSCLISKSSKNLEFIKTTSQFQARSDNLKSQNLNFKQDLRI